RGKPHHPAPLAGRDERRHAAHRPDLRFRPGDHRPARHQVGHRCQRRSDRAAPGLTFCMLRRCGDATRRGAEPLAGAWLSLVERLLGEQDVGGSNPLAPTIIVRPEGTVSMARARIFRPTKNAMQSGTAMTKCWVLEYEPASKREPDPLMGWASARDTLNQ